MAAQKGWLSPIFRRPDFFPPASPDDALVQVLMSHPQDADRILSIASTTRRRLDQKPLSANELSAKFMGAMTIQ